MLFGMVSDGVDRAMGVLDGGGERRRESVVWVVNLEHPIVTNGDFVAYSCLGKLVFYSR